MGNLSRKEFNIDKTLKSTTLLFLPLYWKTPATCFKCLKYSGCAGSISSSCINFGGLQYFYTITWYLIRQYLTYQVFHTSIWILSNYKQWHKVLQISICILTGHSRVSEGYTNHWISWNIFFIYTRMLVFCFYKLWYFARKMW